MGSRRASLTAAALVLLGALVAADIGAAGTVGRGRPLTVAAALGLDDPSATSDLDRRRAVAVAWFTARCMAGRGFVHIATPEPAPDIPDGDMEPVAWAERWGFGISTSAAFPVPVTTVDSNLIGIAKLPPRTRSMVLRALLGDGRTAGCATLAARSVHGLRDRELAPLRKELTALAGTIDADPEVQDALARWRICAGTAADRRDHVAFLMDAFRQRTEALHRLPDALARLQDEERGVAAMISRCDKGYGLVRVRVRERLEAPFVDRHRVALAAIGARIRGVESAYPNLPGSGP